MKSRNFVAVIMSTVLAFTAMAGIAAADDFKRVGVRVRADLVIPDVSVDSRLDGLGISADTTLVPGLDFEYFFTRNISSELNLALSKTGITSNGNALGSVWLLPPSLTVKYHPIPNCKVSPYVGAGVNVVIPFKEKANGVLDVPDFKIYNSVGWVAQAGVDVALTDSMFFNVDFKYLNVETQARINGTKYDLNLNPYIIGTGIGYRF
jgi:outer membrane protein